MGALSWTGVIKDNVEGKITQESRISKYLCASGRVNIEFLCQSQCFTKKYFIFINFRMYSQEKEAITTAKCWSLSFFIDTQFANLNQFQIKGRRIKLIAKYIWGIQLLGGIPIATKSHFSVRVIKTKRGIISFGVVDSKLRNERDVHYWERNVIFYHGFHRRVTGDGKGNIKQEGQKVKEGQIVTVRVDQDKGEIRWEINGKKIAQYQMEKLKNKSIEWVPYLLLANTGDECEWIE